MVGPLLEGASWQLMDSETRLSRFRWRISHLSLATEYRDNPANTIEFLVTQPSKIPTAFYRFANFPHAKQDHNKVCPFHGVWIDCLVLGERSQKRLHAPRKRSSRPPLQQIA